MPTVNQRRNELKSKLVVDTMTKLFQYTKTEMELDIPVWSNVHPVLQLTENDVGMNVAIASENWNFTAQLHGFTDNGNCELKIMDRNANRGVNSRRVVYPEEIILHPDELTESRLERHGIEVYDGRSV